MKQEPFGWFWFESTENKSPYTQITGYTQEMFSRTCPDDTTKIDDGFLIPLFTNPVKELSGVEIIGMSGKYDFSYDVDIIDFARAILRKAQEK